MNKFLILCVVSVLSLGGFASAEDVILPEGLPVLVMPSTLPMIVGNKICPVSGEKIAADALGKVSVTYNGQSFNLCCDKCKEKFLADPEKFSKVAEEEVRGAAKSVVSQLPQASAVMDTMELPVLPQMPEFSFPPTPLPEENAPEKE